MKRPLEAYAFRGADQLIWQLILPFLHIYFAAASQAMPSSILMMRLQSVRVDMRWDIISRVFPACWVLRVWMSSFLEKMQSRGSAPA